jgi:hypothetical protein
MEITLWSCRHGCAVAVVTALPGMEGGAAEEEGCNHGHVLACAPSSYYSER